MKQDGWGVRGAACVEAWAFSVEIPREGEGPLLADLRDGEPLGMVSTPPKALRPLSLAWELYVPSNALSICLPAT